MFKSFFFAFFFLYYPLQALTLKEKFSKGSPGDFIILEKDKTSSAFIFRSIDENSILLEEITIPSYIASKKILWKGWIESGAPGNTSWLIYEIDLSNGTIKQCYSLSRKTYIAIKDADTILTTLLSLPLIKLAENERKKIGPPPSENGPDFRKIWQPPHYFEGEKKSGIFDAYKAKWPKDHSELSEKWIEIYFDAKNERFPFPYWVQISDGSLTFKMRVIDSGMEAKTPHSFWIKRPYFQGGAIETESHITLNAYFPQPSKKIALYLSSFEDDEKIPVAFTLTSEKEKVKTFIVDKNDLKNLKLQSVYLWKIEFDGEEIEADEPFVWNG